MSLCACSRVWRQLCVYKSWKLCSNHGSQKTSQCSRLCRIGSRICRTASRLSSSLPRCFFVFGVVMAALRRDDFHLQIRRRACRIYPCCTSGQQYLHATCHLTATATSTGTGVYTGIVQEGVTSTPLLSFRVTFIINGSICMDGDGTWI